MNQFMKGLDKDEACFLYFSEEFHGFSKEKKKNGNLSINSRQKLRTINNTSRKRCLTIICLLLCLVTKNFLGNTKADNCVFI